MTDDKTNPMGKDLWAPRSVDDTLCLYANWADSYEADVTALGYATPHRAAHLLAAHLPERATAILDFGCGTGLGGHALARAGFTQIDGTDVSAEMRAQASAKGAYRQVFAATPGQMPDVTPGTYGAIAAVGVISLGAAPPETLAPLLEVLAPGGLLVLSYNDATLRCAAYMQALCDVQVSGQALLLSAQYGPHLPGKEGARGATVYLLRRL